MSNILNTFLLYLWKPYFFPRWFSRPIHKILVKRNIAPDFNFKEKFFGLVYEGNFDNHIDFYIFYFGAFEKPILYFMRDYLQAIQKKETLQESIFIDIGANIGQHSLFMSRLVDKVHAFEPFEKVSQRIEWQIESNQLNNIIIHKVGISDSNAFMPFFAPTGLNLGIGSFDQGTTTKGNEYIGDLKVVRGDDYFLENNISKVTIMKIDVEGLEKLVLKGFAKTLKQHRPMILLEISYGEKLSFNSLQEITDLLPEDYQLFVFKKRKKEVEKPEEKKHKIVSPGSTNLYHLSLNLLLDKMILSLALTNSLIKLIIY